MKTSTLLGHLEWIRAEAGMPEVENAELDTEMDMAIYQLGEIAGYVAAMQAILAEEVADKAT